jgi:hypothetical protein
VEAVPRESTNTRPSATSGYVAAPRTGFSHRTQSGVEIASFGCAPVWLELIWNVSALDDED